MLGRRGGREGGERSVHDIGQGSARRPRLTLRSVKDRDDDRESAGEIGYPRGDGFGLVN